MISRGRMSMNADELYRHISGEEILKKYVGVEFVPSLIHSPLRHDEQKSFSLFYNSRGVVLFKDHGSGLSGDVVELLALLWKCTREEVVTKVWNDCDCPSRVPAPPQQQQPTSIQFKMRDWEQRDMDFWGKYGIMMPWLKMADIFPISHFVLVRGSNNTIYKADNLAYVFYHDKGIKLYQPYSQIKWLSTQKKNLVQLYERLPETGDKVCVCSSMKDALCLWANTGIPCVAPQSEGIPLPCSIVEDLRNRFTECYIMYDNDAAGIDYAKEAAKETGFTNVLLPKFKGGKDISDLYKLLENKDDFQKIKNLFNGKHHQENVD